jgi:4-hydroxybenzoate polyprenyltransferase
MTSRFNSLAPLYLFNPAPRLLRRHSLLRLSFHSTKSLFPCQSHRQGPSQTTSRCFSLSRDRPQQSDAQQLPTTYEPPKSGIISKLPPSWIPYAELIRLDKPAGTYYLFFPCLFSTLLAAPLAPAAPPLAILGTTGLFFAGALIMRGAGCTINDLWDRNLDPHVERTRLRPIARRAITPENAIVYLGFQLLAGLGILLSFPTQCFFYGAPSLLLVVTYPLAKRVTNYPQFVLGLAFSWGAFMGFPALGIDLLHSPSALAAAGALYASCVAWTLNYDMIYAFMDIKDDVNAGIKSIALAHDHNAKAVLAGVSVAQIGLLGIAGYCAGAGPIFFLGSCGGAAVALATIIRRINLRSVRDCWWWFVNGAWITGGTISAGLLADYLYRRERKDPRLLASPM